MSARRAAICSGLVLLAVYVATMAPGVTFWDAGEFIAAAKTLGIPHPPGTPLFVIALNVWTRLWWFLPSAVATNLFSAFCTASAVALGALFVGKAFGAMREVAWVALAAGLVSGGMSSVWSNATETEVYAASLLLAMAMLWASDCAGRTGERRWVVLTTYLLALSVPLHTSALVAAPAVIWLAVERRDGTFDWAAGFGLFGVATIAAGVSRWSVALMTTGAIIVAVQALLVRRRWRGAARDALAEYCATAIALSALLFMLLRARHDPAINQGDPSSMQRLTEAVSRAQYDVAGVWPRRAPFWLQISNWFEYADWQTALTLGPSVIPTVARVLATLVFAGFGLTGFLWHRAVDRRTWRALTLLFACGSIGVIVYLNLKAGTSFGWAFVPDGDSHEARDRDYFFVLGFWTWGLWAGMGVVRLAMRFRFPWAFGVAVAALPILLNWSAVSRRSQPELALPSALAGQLLDSLPTGAVLFTAGDNDTYPVWYEQQVNDRRRDVTVVTLPLLEADWYYREFERRTHLSLGGMPAGYSKRSARVASVARAAGRAIAASIAVEGGDRAPIGADWIMRGLFAVSRSRPLTNNGSGVDLPVMQIDTSAVAAVRDLVDRRLGRGAIRESVDPVDAYAIRLLSCPRLVLLRAPSKADLASLDSTCNLR
ncbi:MAG: DUF2723 domain-containing protein [Gemmatimonadaceae bacterium]